MAEPHRLKSSADADRDTRAEALLVEGLDRYLAGRFEDAIHIWTRVLFLDRSHARARAYIDRARTAIAERQRAADEMLHASSELLTRGDAAEARRLLAEALDTTGDAERAAALRTRIERLERAELHASPAPAIAARTEPSAATRPAFGRSWRNLAALGVAVFGLTLLLTPALSGLLGLGRTRPRLTPTAPERPLAVLSSSEVALVRARTLHARGRLAEALQALDRVSDASFAGEATQLRVQIQQVLLASGASARREPAAGSTLPAGRE